jgi:hypothetical protein
MSLILLSYASLINKEGISMRKKSKGRLAGSIPGLWVAGYVIDWYQRFWLKHRAESVGQSLVVEIEL